MRLPILFNIRQYPFVIITSPMYVTAILYWNFSLNTIVWFSKFPWRNGVDNLTRTIINYPPLFPPFIDDRCVIYGDQRVSNQLKGGAKSRLRSAICERRSGRLFRIEGVVSYGLLAPILRAITDITLSRRAPECYRSTSHPHHPYQSALDFRLPCVAFVERL